MNLLAALEGLLFLCGDDGLRFEEIKTILEIDAVQLEEIIEKLMTIYDSTNSGIKLEKFGDIYKLVTKSKYNNFYKKLVEIEQQKPLTNAALEVLAIIAYNEPITRVMVDEIRGVNSSYIIRNLMARELICEIGRSDLPGRPFLYKTTNKFLDTFGITSLNDLPIIEKQSVLNESDDLYKSKYIENKTNV